MSISSTGIYGNTSILNSEIYTDIINDIEDINTNKIPNLILDISENRFDISQNKADISENRFDISQNKADISLNRTDISQNRADISENRFDISQNRADISLNRFDISQNKADISLNRTDISQNRADFSNTISLNSLVNLILPVISSKYFDLNCFTTCINVWFLNGRSFFSHNTFTSLYVIL